MTGRLRLRAGTVIEAPIDEVWALLARYCYWPDWGPTVRRVEAQADEVIPGATGRVLTVLGIWLPFEITSVVPQSSWRWRVAGIPATDHELAVLAPDRTLVEFTVPVLFAPYVVVLREGLRRLKRLAEGSTRHT